MLPACEKGSKSFKKECREKRDHEARSTAVAGGFNSDADRLGWQGQRTCADSARKVKVRLADKISGMQQLSKMTGWNEPERVEVSGDTLSRYIIELRKEPIFGGGRVIDTRRCRRWLSIGCRGGLFMHENRGRRPKVRIPSFERLTADGKV